MTVTVELVGLEVFGRHVSDAAEYRLIEALASAVADELATRFPAERVQVRVRKPGLRPAGLTVAYSAATAKRGP
jgi:dihydroneopterin aldolase